MENKFCTKCGTKQEGNNFCSKCGNNLITKEHKEEPNNHIQDAHKPFIEEKSDIEQQQVNSLMDKDENKQQDDTNKKPTSISGFKSCFFGIIWFIIMSILWTVINSGSLKFGAIPNIIFWSGGATLGVAIIRNVLGVSSPLRKGINKDIAKFENRKDKKD